MKAARWFAAGDMRIVETPSPVPSPGQLLVRVDAAGICGTDLEEYLHGPASITPPMDGAGLILGHEVVGTVVESNSPEWKPGDRVVPDVVVGCGRCFWCNRGDMGLCENLQVRGMSMDGGLAEFMVADAATCLRIPDHVEARVAVFAEPASVAVRAMHKVREPEGAVVVVTGLGSIGLLVAQVALLRGARAVIASDPSQSKRELAASFGATAVHPTDLREVSLDVSDGRGPDIAMECSGVTSVVRECIEMVRPGGEVVLVGMRMADVSFPLLHVVLGERQIKGSAAHVWDVDVAPALELLATGALRSEPLLTRCVDLEDVVDQGLDYMATNPDCLKVVVEPNREGRS